ncbi:MAG: signal peptidase II [Candidatus Omnitrophota bacterium]
MIYIIVLIILSLDQSTKLLITKNFVHHESLPLLKGVFHITLTHNTGAAFGILKNQLPLFIFTSLFAVCLIYAIIRKHKEGRFYSLALSLILGGALGNLIDRVRLGYVIDFLDFRIWPVFNIADSAITIGAVLLAVSVLRTKKT